MAVPALRQPKLNDNKCKSATEVENVIVSLKDGKKLVILSDAYHGIIMKSDRFRCVFCGIDMDLDMNNKEQHKKSEGHVENLKNYPHADGYGANLVRKLDEDTWYCTTCRAIIPKSCLSRHINTFCHSEVLEVAITKATAYKFV